MQVQGQMKGVTAAAHHIQSMGAIITGKFEFPHSHELWDEAAGLQGVSIQVTFSSEEQPDEPFHGFVARAGVTSAKSKKNEPSDEEGGEVEREDTMGLAFTAPYVHALFEKLLRWQGANRNLMFSIIPSQIDAFPRTNGDDDKEVVEREPTGPVQERMHVDGERRAKGTKKAKPKLKMMRGKGKRR